MLGFVGFFIAAIIISLFAISFYVSFKELLMNQRQSFAGAFLLLGLALFVWGFAPLINNPDVTVALVFAGDALLILGSGLLINAQFKFPKLWLVISLADTCAALLTTRAFVYPPAAFVQDGLLHFNLEGVPRYVVVALLAFVWMLLGTRITQLAVRSRRVPQFGGAIALIYIVSLVCAALFISARQNVMIVASFAALAFTFLVLACIPLLITRYSRGAVVKEKVVAGKGTSHGK